MSGFLCQFFSLHFLKIYIYKKRDGIKSTISFHITREAFRNPVYTEKMFQDDTNIMPDLQVNEL